MVADGIVDRVDVDVEDKVGLLDDKAVDELPGVVSVETKWPDDGVAVDAILLVCMVDLGINGDWGGWLAGTAARLLVCVDCCSKDEMDVVVIVEYEEEEEEEIGLV